MSKKVYNRIKVALAEKSVTNKELSEAIDVNEKTVSHWCTNTTQPSIQTLFLIADYLKVDVRNLLVVNKNAPRK